MTDSSSGHDTELKRANTLNRQVVAFILCDDGCPNRARRERNQHVVYQRGSASCGVAAHDLQTTEHLSRILIDGNRWQQEASNGSKTSGDALEQLRSLGANAPAKSSIMTILLKCLTAPGAKNSSSYRPLLSQSMYTLVSMTIRCISAKDFTETAFAARGFEGGIDFRLGHDHIKGVL